MTADPPADRPAALSDHVQATLAGLDGVDLAGHPEVFEALDAAILAELRALEPKRPG